MIGSQQVETLLARLARQVDELPSDRRAALGKMMNDAIEKEQTAGVEGQLRERIAQRVAGGDTLAAIAGRAGLHTSPFYRWWKGGADLKLASFVALCKALEMHLAPIASSTSSKKGRAAR
jgi:DNA-binding phage protein